MTNASARVLSNTALAQPDFFGVPNWAISPLPQIDPATGGILAGTGMRKFVDTLPGLCGVAGATNDLGQCLPIATPDPTAFSGSDYYHIALQEYTQKMHLDLPATPLRGYVQLDGTGAPMAQQYLGPLILATTNRPVRVLFENKLTTDLPLPVDTTYMGAGTVSDGTNSAISSQKRSDIHLHGGNTPWISDGTPHQWVTPAGGDGQPDAPGFAKGLSFANVPDMSSLVGTPNPDGSPNRLDGKATHYWTNQQSGKLMFYHEHAYGTTRLGVYAGIAAGYLLVNPPEESALLSAGVPGTIVTDPATGVIQTADLTHLVPLVIQDRTFVPDNGAAGGQLAAQDPTWDVASMGGKGALWFPHVYMPNQNPADETGANAFGRWDYGAWFWPPQDPTTFVSQPYVCSSAAYPAGSPPAFPPLMCPGIPNPSGVPEGFMDTPVINGTAYPSLSVQPTAYRFRILNADNDRGMNLQLYVADPMNIAVLNPGSGYTAPPAVTISAPVSGVTATATAIMSSGIITGLVPVSVGSGYTAPTISFTGGGGGSGAIATATVDPGTGAITGYTVTNGGSGYTLAPTVVITDATGSGAAATATLLPVGSVSGFTVTNPGSGYTTLNPPLVSIAAPPAGGVQATAVAAANTEVKMLPAAPPMQGGALPLCATANPITTPSLGVGLAGGLLDGGGHPLNGTGLPSGCWPTTWPTDGRDGGVPDPTTAGPAIIQIGTEGGVLPNPVVIPSTPVGYEYGRRSITVLNVSTHGLFIGPAERADIVIDFSLFAGKTLIVYNDSPAPIPAFDPRNDYYTGDVDNSPIGGAPTTMPGYGPNTRTIMQIQVAPTGATAPFSITALQTTLPSLFVSQQDPIIVPEAAYPAGNGFGPNKYSRIQDTSLTFAPQCATPPCATITQPMIPKTIQELFTLDYGRMNATLGVELPFTNFLTQTTIPYGYVDPPTEMFKNGETQIWKITHNGVDTHFIHFHLFDLQVINRVGWDGTIRPAEANELGWKDTIRMNPLEDIVVALRPWEQRNLPWPVPNSVRPLDVTKPVGSSLPNEFTNVDPTNQPATVTNDLTNLGWEYVWHCHILGHEENDMMRVMMLAAAPDVPGLTATPVFTPGGINIDLAWTETSINQTGFTIQRATDSGFTQNVTNITVGPTPLTYTDSTFPAGSALYYQIKASNLVGYTKAYAAPAAGYPNTSADSAWSAPASVPYTPVAAVNTALLAFGNQALNTTSAAQVATLSNNGIAPLSITSITVTGTNSGDFARTTTCGASLAAGASCTISVKFTPTAIGARSASVSIVTNDPVNPTLTVSLTGTGTAPVNSVSPLSLTFSAVMNTTTASQPVTVTNTGNSALTITGITITGTSSSQFAQTNNCVSPLAASASCQINVTFHPTGGGTATRSASLHVNVSAPATSQTVTLTGTIIVPPFGLSTTSLNFGNVTSGTVSAVRTVVVTNATTAPLPFGGVAMSGIDPTQFAQTNNCPASLAVGGRCTISVTFRPTSTGAKSAVMTVTAGVTPVSVPVTLSGTGI